MIRYVWWENQMDQQIFYEWVLNTGGEVICLQAQAIALAMETRDLDGDKELLIR